MSRFTVALSWGLLALLDAANASCQQASGMTFCSALNGQPMSTVFTPTDADAVARGLAAAMVPSACLRARAAGACGRRVA